MTNPVPCAPFPVFRAFDSTGKPLAGGTLSTFAAGTTTPLNSFTDAGGGTPNANPVVLDSTGSAPVFLSNAPYKLVLKDSNGVTQWTEDNVIAAPFISSAMATVVGTATTAAALTALGGVTSTVVASMIAAAINNYVTDTGTANAYVITPSPVITYTSGTTVKVKIAGGANTTTTPTLNANALGAKVIFRDDGTAVAAGDITNGVMTFIYDTSLNTGAGGWYIQGVVPSQFPQPTTPVKSFRNLKGAYASSSSATYTADNLILLNSTGAAVNLAAFNKTLNTGTAGAGGLDTGSLAASTWYYVYAIYNSASTGTQNILFSASATAPTMPSGYTYSALIGCFLLDGSKNMIGYIQRAECWTYQVGNNLTFLPTVASGTQAQWTAIAVSGFVPTTIARSIFLQTTQNDNTCQVAPNGNYPTWIEGGSPTGLPWGGVNTLESSMGCMVDMPLESTNVYVYQGSQSWVACGGFRINF